MKLCCLIFILTCHILVHLAMQNIWIMLNMQVNYIFHLELISDAFCCSLLYCISIAVVVMALVISVN